MKVVIPGGTGDVGAILHRYYTSVGFEVVILSRNPGPGQIRWDGETLGEWTTTFEGADVVINLAGRTVNCRYTESNLKEMMDSRVLSTRVVGQAIAQCATPPKVWLQASTATIYPHRFDAPNDEFTERIENPAPGTPPKWQRSEEIARAWEEELRLAQTPQTRKIALRSAMTMSPEAGGIFDVLYGLVRKGLGGAVAGGKQYVSWVHEADFCRSLDFLIANEEIQGAVNICSPNPIPYGEFMKQLRQAAGVSVGLPATRWMVEVGTRLMNTESELVLKSRRVVPTRLLKAGFKYMYPYWSEAAAELVKRSPR